MQFHLWIFAQVTSDGPHIVSHTEELQEYLLVLITYTPVATADNVVADKSLDLLFKPLHRLGPAHFQDEAKWGRMVLTWKVEKLQRCDGRRGGQF